MTTQEEKRNQLEEILLDKEEEEYAEKVAELTDVQVDKLHNMMSILRGQNEMRTRIVHKIKYDILGFLARGDGFAAYCDTDPFVLQDTE